MNMLIATLLLINLGMVLIYSSGFFEVMDGMINKKFPPYHLPYPFHCVLCGTFWMSLLYIIISGNFTIPGIVLCLVSAHLTEITTPLVRLVKNILLTIIKIINKVVTPEW